MDSAERLWAVSRIGKWAPPRWVRAWWASRLRPLPFFVLLVWALARLRGSGLDFHARSPEAAVAHGLAARGLSCRAGDVAWIDDPAPAGHARRVRWRTALVHAHASGQAADLYRVEVRLSPEGVVLGLGTAHDLTRTPAVDESRPLVRGTLAAYTTGAEGLVTAVHVLDLSGRPRARSDALTRVERLQAALTNLQQTGSTAGVVHDAFVLDPVARSVTIAWRTSGEAALPPDPNRDGERQDELRLEVRADGQAIVLDPLTPRAISGQRWVRVVPDERARPGALVTWAVDRVRAMPWFGSDRMQWVKAVAFTALDMFRATFARGTTAQQVRDELGLQGANVAAPAFPDPDVGWPPPPMTVPIAPPLPGEGRWIALDRDPFITPIPGLGGGSAPAFATSFVRPDKTRPDVRVYVTLWDPRQVALHMQAGTVEPVSADGEHGPGIVPRTPKVMRRLVAAFNGGFQAQHGEFGMRVDGIEYLPPKPYAATVMELEDGSNAFGSWPGQDGVPRQDIVAFRQNLTALVQDARFNPWGRTWWGGTPPGWTDRVHSARSAICLTKDGFVGYFYSASISAQDLAMGMLDARCTFGIHLDMNPGHAGFEFYDVAPAGELVPLTRALQGDWEAQGKVPGMDGWVFRSRRMIRSMGHMLFPRYIHREARDFFYLTSRTLLPGAPIASPGAGPKDGVWRTQGLPQHGFPYALAVTAVHVSPGGVELRVVRADPRTMAPSRAHLPSPGGDDGSPHGAPHAGEGDAILTLSAPVRGPSTLWWSPGAFSVSTGTPPAQGAMALAAGYPVGAAPATSARAAVGVQDEDGMLAWVELPPDARPSAELAAAMDALLDRLGCSHRMLLPGDARALLGGSLDAAGQPVTASSAARSAATEEAGAPGRAAPMMLPAPTVRLVRTSAPDAHATFERTPIVARSVWQPLQAKRVRYFPHPAPSSATTPAPPPSP